MKKILLVSMCFVVILGFSTCSSSSNEAEVASVQETVETPSEEPKKENETVDEDKPIQITHIDVSQYTILMTYFASLTSEVTHDEIIAFCDDNNLFHRREDYTGGTFELKIANDSEAALIKYCRNPGENIFFNFDKEGKLTSAEYSSNDKPQKEVLFYCGGGKVFGWDGLSKSNAWYYRHSEGKERTTIMCDNPEEAIDKALAE